MFEKSRNYDKERRIAKKANNQVAEKKIENMMRLKLREKLEANLRNNDKVEIEINAKYTSLFLSIVSEEFAADYDYTQVSPTLYIFSAKSIDW